MQLGRLFYAGRREKLSKNCTARFSGFRKVFKICSVKLCHLFFSLQQKHNTHIRCWQILLSAVPESLPSSSFSSTLCTLRPSVYECVLRLSYITTLSYMPGFTRGGSSVITLLPLFFWAWFCYQFRDFFLLASCSSSGRCVLVRLQLDTTHNQYNPHLLVATWLKNRNPGNNREAPTLVWLLKPATLGFVNATTHLFLGRSLRVDRPPANMDLLRSVHSSSNNPRSQRQRVQDDPHAYSQLDSTLFPFGGDTTRLPESASQQSVQPFLEVSQLRAQNSLFR